MPAPYEVSFSRHVDGNGRSIGWIATVTLGIIYFEVNCEHCGTEFFFGKEIGSRVSGRSAVQALIDAEPTIIALQESIKWAVKTGESADLSEDTDIYEKCPRCEYTQSWMTGGLTIVRERGAAFLAGALPGVICFFFPAPLMNLLSSVSAQYRPVSAVILTITLMLVSGLTGKKLAARYRQRVADKHSEQYGNPAPRNPTVSWKGYDPETESDLPSVKGRDPRANYWLTYIGGNNDPLPESQRAEVLQFIIAWNQPLKHRAALAARRKKLTRCQCPHCGEFVRVPPDRLGKRGKCPDCGNRFIAKAE